ncbi:MAG: hypothetical protein ACREI9_02235 [Nitrospiraceae bacterium]
MKTYGYKLSFFLGVLALVGLIGCKQEAPAGKAGAPAKSAVESNVEQAGQAAVDAMKTPMDKARQTEGKLEKSAEQTAEQVKKATQ